MNAGLDDARDDRRARVGFDWPSFGIHLRRVGRRRQPRFNRSHERRNASARESGCHEHGNDLIVRAFRAEIALDLFEWRLHTFEQFL